MPEAKIKRKSYSFDIRKKFQYVDHFKVKERPPIEKVKDELKKLLKPKAASTASRGALPASAGSKSASPPGGFNFILLGAFIFIALLLLGVAYVYISVGLSQPVATTFQPQVVAPQFNGVVTGSEILTAGERNAPKHVAAILIDQQLSGLSNYTVNLTPYGKYLPSEVFILESERFEATSYPAFFQSLRAKLSKKHIVMNSITLGQLETLPKGAVIIIPSGVMPQEMLGLGSKISLNSLAERGVVLVYIGQPFTKMLNGSLVVSTPASVLKTLPVVFDPSAPPDSTGGFHLFQPLYTAYPNGDWASGMVYGSVSVLTKGNGAMIFLPQTLDGGWRGVADDVASDVSRIILETAWAQPIAPTKTYTMQSNESSSNYYFTEPFSSGNVSIRIDVVGYSSTATEPVYQTLFARAERAIPSDLFIESGGTIIPTNITGKAIRINAILKEPQAYEFDPSIVFVDSSDRDAQTLPKDTTSTQTDRSFDAVIYVDKGEYIAKLVDGAGKLYAQGYMQVTSLDITYHGTSQQKPSVYLFDATMAGNPYTVGDVSVVVDGGKYGSYSFKNVDHMNIDVGSFSGNEQLPNGKHTFSFTAGGLKVDVPVEHARTHTIFDEPLFWITMILTGGIVMVGVVFARQEEIYYSIDIPDFPPVARTRIPLMSDVVLSIFEKVNETYRWQNTPLTVSEIKNGFKAIFYQGKPIYITDYNVEFLLNDLVSNGRIKESLGYYGLLGWEKTGHSIEYLALMRRVRDICVNNAVPFTLIGESKEADTVITVVGQQMFVHIYDKGQDPKELIHNTLATLGQGISIILFKNPIDKAAFQNVINSSPSAASLIVKMETDSSSLLLQTSDELEKMVQEFKSI